MFHDLRRGCGVQIVQAPGEPLRDPGGLTAGFSDLHGSSVHEPAVEAGHCARHRRPIRLLAGNRSHSELCYRNRLSVGIEDTNPDDWFFTDRLSPTRLDAALSKALAL